jgi:hypothetical protein
MHDGAGQVRKSRCQLGFDAGEAGLGKGRISLVADANDLPAFMAAADHTLKNHQGTSLWAQHLLGEVRKVNGGLGQMRSRHAGPSPA